MDSPLSQCPLVEGKFRRGKEGSGSLHQSVRVQEFQFLCVRRKESISYCRARQRITALHFGQFFRCAQNAGVKIIRRNRLQGLGSIADNP